ncbi:MAG: PIN domain-containing protein [Gemmatimonadota bacterium]
MPDDIERYYWDSCVFLSYIQNLAHRAGEIEAHLQKAADGKLEIVTSTVSIVEVAFDQQEKAGKVLSVEAEERIRNLWLPPSPVKLAEFHALIAENARQLLREAMASALGLKPMDAIHLATAILLGIDVFHTYDSGLKKFESMTGLKIREPLLPQPSLDLPPG